MGGEEIGPARSRHPLRGGGGGGIKGGDGGEWSELGKAAERREGRAGPEAAAATMQEIIASVDHIKFDLEIAVEQQLGAQPLPFPGMDSEHGARRVGDADSDRGLPQPGVTGPSPSPSSSFSVLGHPRVT